MPARAMPPYHTGLHELGDGLFAYLQWRGEWGVSNAGLVVAEEALLAVDSLAAPSMTRAFIEAARRVSAAPFRTLVNTHSHSDHVGGNQLFSGAEIIAHVNCRPEWEAALAHPNVDPGLGPRISRAWQAREEQARGQAWRAEVASIVPTFPTRELEGELTLRHGVHELRLLHWGPAHTRSDVMVYAPASRTLFAGDLAFFYATPIARASVANWLRIIDRIDHDLAVDRIIPGHGPPGGRLELADQREYLDFLLTRARDCFEAGLSEEQAAEAIDLGAWARWPETERKEMNIVTLYRAFRAEGSAR